jgi:predicted AAA+ superfamily ATPase
MTIAHAVFLLAPFHGGGRRELTRKPKCYAFDTGFVSFIKGWDSIREDDRGLLWEHLVLDTLRTIEHENNLFFWRDKSGREIDFIIKRDRHNVDAFECKVNPANFSLKNLKVFRKIYPHGRNICISPNISESYRIRKENLLVEFHSLQSILV